MAPPARVSCASRIPSSRTSCCAAGRPVVFGSASAAARPDQNADKPWSGDPATKYRDLVPERQDLGVLRTVEAAQRDEPREHHGDHQVQQSHGHNDRPVASTTPDEIHSGQR